MQKRIKAAVRAVFLYLLMTVGLWMFLDSYSKSYNRISGEEMIPAGLVMGKETATIMITDKKYTLDLGAFAAESKTYFTAYMLSPDDIRSSAYLISLCYRH